MGINSADLKQASPRRISPTGSIVAVLVAFLAVVSGATVTAWNATDLMDALNSQQHGEGGSSSLVNDFEPAATCS